MTGSQIFILLLMIGGAFSLALILMGLGFYYRGKSMYKDREKDDNN